MVRTLAGGDWGPVKASSISQKCGSARFALAVTIATGRLLPELPNYQSAQPGSCFSFLPFQLFLTYSSIIERNPAFSLLADIKLLSLGSKYAEAAIEQSPPLPTL